MRTGYAVAASSAKSAHCGVAPVSRAAPDDEKLKRERVVFDAYLTKPVDFDELLAKIDELT